MVGNFRPLIRYLSKVFTAFVRREAVPARAGELALLSGRMSSPRQLRCFAQNLRQTTNAGAGKVGVGENQVERHQTLAPFA